MKKIDEGYDNLLKSNYELYSLPLSELKQMARSWYDGIDLKQYDNRNNYNYESQECNLSLIKHAGIVTNYFFAYRENEKYYLMDGFNRLFTDYGKINSDSTVYLKLLTDKLSDHHLMLTMFMLNVWKMGGNDMMATNIGDFLDRGFCLFLYTKFGIKFYSYDKDEKKNTGDNYVNYQKRSQYSDDISVLKYYFRNESNTWAAAHYYNSIAQIFSNKNIINDLREIINSNKYKEEPFKNHYHFLLGFVMFVSWRRYLGDEAEYKYQTYLDKLYADEKYFKKIKSMAGNDCTRQNIYRWYRQMYVIT